MYNNTGIYCITISKALEYRVQLLYGHHKGQVVPDSLALSKNNRAATCRKS